MLFGGGERNAVPIYDIEECIVDYRFSAHSPPRTSALRSLGAHGNVFAIESMLDELAAAVGMEPLAIRLRNLKDERSVAVLEAVGWFACVVEVELSHGVRGREMHVNIMERSAMAPMRVGECIMGPVVHSPPMRCATPGCLCQRDADHA